MSAFTRTEVLYGSNPPVPLIISETHTITFILPAHAGAFLLISLSLSRVFYCT